MYVQHKFSDYYRRHEVETLNNFCSVDGTYPFETRSTAFSRPMGYNPKKAHSVYRLIGAALIGNFLMFPSYFKIKILTKCREYSMLGVKGLSYSHFLNYLWLFSSMFLSHFFFNLTLCSYSFIMIIYFKMYGTLYYFF